MPLNLLRNRGIKIKACVDTNIYVYAIIHHPVFGDLCFTILRKMEKGFFEGYGSLMVAIELLGSLSKINTKIARKAVELYFSLNVNILPLNEEVLNLASVINQVVNVKNDSIHTAIVMLNKIPVVVTNDLDNWLKLSENYSLVLKKAREEGF